VQERERERAHVCKRGTREITTSLDEQREKTNITCAHSRTKTHRHTDTQTHRHTDAPTHRHTDT